MQEDLSQPSRQDKGPIKLRYKQETKDASPLHKQVANAGPTVVEKPSSGATGTEGIGKPPKTSKIEGVAVKTGPRIGPQYQADIPELLK